jgi:phosphate-selective porin OprO/OprP
MMTRTFAILIFVGGFATFSAVARAEEPPADEDAVTTQEQIEELEQRIKILERKQELEKEAAAEKSKDTALAGAGKDGFFIRSADGGFALKIRGLVQFDSRSFQTEPVFAVRDTFVMRRVRPIFEGTVFKYFDFKIMPDFAQGTTVLADAYIDARISPAVKIRGGKYKVPIGLERLQSAKDIVFVDRGLPTNLVPFRDIGVQVFGDPLGGAISYAVGVFNGVVDAQGLDVDVNDGKTVAARAFFLPFKKSSITGLQGLGFGLAGTTGSMDGTLTTPSLPSYRTAGQRVFFVYRFDGTAAGSAIAAGRQARLNPELYYYNGRFGLMAEYNTSAQQVDVATSSDYLTTSAWGATATFLLTSDKASYTGVDPRKSIGGKVPGPGAFELAARYGVLDVDDDAFPVFANPDVSASQATEIAAGVNWYLNKNLKVMLDGSRTSFEGGDPTGDRESENVLQTRFQIGF